MFQIQRRQFLRAASALAGSAYLGRGLADEHAPAFSDKPAFDPPAVFLTWQGDPTTTMTVQWIGGPDDGRDRPIWYAQEGAVDWRQQPCQSKPFPSSKNLIYRAELKNLAPGAEYRFRIGLDSAERRFRTMPRTATDTIEFITGGDAGVGQPAQHTNKVAASQDPMFVVMGGDLAYENGVLGPVFFRFLKNYSDQLIDSQGRLIPLVGCLGNHEVRGGYEKGRNEAPFFYSVFDGLFPETGYATLDFGDYLSIILLDSNHTSPIEGEQTSWLRQQLREREDCPNVFVVHHVPAYPSFRPVDLDDAERGTGAAARQHWVPLFERYNVDAVLEHHDHTFKRTHPMLDGPVDKNGVPYLGDGSWGQLRRPKTTAERPYLAVADESYHLSLHRIEGPDRFHIALSDKGKVVDVYQTRKRSRMLPANPAL